MKTDMSDSAKAKVVELMSDISSGIPLESLKDSDKDLLLEALGEDWKKELFGS